MDKYGLSFFLNNNKNAKVMLICRLEGALVFINTYGEAER